MTDLHLIRLPLRLRAFTEWALGRRYFRVPPGDGRGRPREPDPGYALHAALAGLFGEKAPRPFTLAPTGNGPRNRACGPGSADIAPVLGYAAMDRDGLATLAQVAKDEFQNLFDWEDLRAKPLPTHWPGGLRLGFELRACPVRRRLAKRPFTTNVTHPERRQVVYSERGREVDAFQLATARAEESGAPLPQRDEVYLAWLKERFASSPDRPPPFTLVEGSVRVRSFRSVRLLRRPRNANGRSAQWLTRPDVRFTGELEVVTGEGVQELLAKGVGRHCGFGFGMVLLRPA